MVERHEFYQKHLDVVSRSFAFCISRLEDPLRSQVGLSYLICRLLDTIEDASWSRGEDQSRAFESFVSFIRYRPERHAIEDWALGFPNDLPEGERALLVDAERIFSDFHSWPEKIRHVVREPVLSMAAGMRHFMSRKAQMGTLKLSSLVEVNQYCFFVAGVVGEILTMLLRVQKDELRFSEKEAETLSLEDAFRFGLFLQKVNLLKDQATDETVGRYLVHDRSQVYGSLRRDGRSAIRYVLNLPQGLTSFRLFCAWSLFLGLASLPWIESAYQGAGVPKLPRGQAEAIFSEIEKIIQDNGALEGLFESMHTELWPPEDDSLRKGPPADSSGTGASAQLAILTSLYSGELSDEGLQGLLSAAH